jgi:arylsulfatase A-like enzyme
VLFISIDDLRPELNAFGQSHIISPNIDKLANEATVFTRAYCNVPVCGASRASLLTGMYPTPSRFTDYKTRVDEETPDVTTLPEHFKNNGYYTTTVGRIFHHPDDGLKGWSKDPYRPDFPNTNAQQELWRDYQAPENLWTSTHISFIAVIYKYSSVYRPLRRLTRIICA